MEQLMELRPHRYASVPNEAADTLPDLNSVGLLTLMLRHAPGYPFTVAGVIKQKSKIPGPKLGKAAAYGAMNVLIGHRWACRVRFMCAGGHWLTGLFRTYTRFTDDDLREVCRRFKAGASIRVRCKGCSKDPEEEIQTVVRPGAKLIWSGSITAGPQYKYGHPITDLMKPGGLLSTASTPAAESSPSSGIPEVGVTCTDDASPQVTPTSGFPTVGQPTVGNPEVFYKTGVEDSSSSSGGSTDSPTPQNPGEDDESPTAQKTPDAAETVMARTDATAEEAEAVVDAIETEADERHTRLGAPKVGQIDAYVAGFADRDLRRHLRSVRAQRASESRTEANQATATEADTTCQEHREQLPCIVCDTSPKPVLSGLLRKYGPIRRPDIARRLDDLTSV